jgi:ATP-dependent Lon protease
MANDKHTMKTRSKNEKKAKKAKKTKKDKKEKKNCKYNKSSDEDDNNHSESDSDYEEVNPEEYERFLAKLFPSNYMNDKIKKNQKIDNTSNLKPNWCPVTACKQIAEENESRLSEILDEYVDEEQEEGDEDEEEEELRGGRNKFNIIFTMGDSRYDEYDDEYYDEEEDESYYESSTEHSENSSEDEEDVEESEDEELPKLESMIETPNDTKMAKTTKKPKKAKKSKSSSIEEEEDILEKFKKMAVELNHKHANSKMAKELMETAENKEKEIEKKKTMRDKKSKNKNMSKFRTLLNDKNVMNDIRYFKEKLNIDEQNKVLNELEAVKEVTKLEKPYRLTLLETDIPPKFKACALKKLGTLRHMEPGSGEYYKIKNWVDTFMQIPFGKIDTLPIQHSDGIEKCHEFMEKSKQILDDAVYGLNDAKLQIMQMVGQLVTNPNAIGSSIAIKGPMGTGKTTLVKEGISKILGRDFAFITLGGATDSSFLEGHSYTYEGSTWGKIVDIIIQSKCMNPVIYFDELDKVSDTPKGEEIIGILTHLTDTSQNQEFHDKFFAELDFDLSKCLFIFSYNDESKINPILKDRMYRIQTKGYEKKDKIEIANNYLLPTIRKQVVFEKEDITIPEETLTYIIETLTEKEEGVRNLKRCLEIIYTKLNLYRLMKPGTNLFGEDMALEVSFPFEVTTEVVDKLIKKTDESGPPMGMYM